MKITIPCLVEQIEMYTQAAERIKMEPQVSVSDDRGVCQITVSSDHPYDFYTLGRIIGAEAAINIINR